MAGRQPRYLRICDASRKRLELCFESVKVRGQTAVESFMQHSNHVSVGHDFIEVREIKFHCVGLEDLIVVKMLMLSYLVLKLYGLTRRYQQLSGINSLHLQS
jgi:hypothetical protein